MLKNLSKYLCLAAMICSSCLSVNASVLEEAKESCGNAYSDYEYLASDLVKVRGSFWRYGVVDRYCRIVVPVEYSNIKESKSNILVEYYGTYGLFDKYGRVIYPVEYDLIESIGTDFYQIQKGQYYAIVHNDGTVINEDYYVDVKQLQGYLIRIGSYDTGLSKLYGLMTKTGYVLIEPKYTKIALINLPFFGFEDEYNFKLSDVFGREMFSYRYNALNHLFATFFRIQNSSKQCGIVNKYGKIIADTVYDKVEIGEDGYFKVKQDGKWGALDSLGKVVFECKYGPFEINKKIKNLPADSEHTRTYQKELQSYNIMLAYFYYYCGEYQASANKLAEIKTRYADSETVNLTQALTSLLYSLGYYISK